MRLSLLMMLALLGCSEHGFHSENPPTAVPNVRPLETSVQVDSILQVTVPKVDILWVVDNSCSMYEEQTAVSENFPIFMDYFLGSGLDYQIGVVSTDMNDATHSGKLRSVNGARWIDPNTIDPIGAFNTMAVMGTSGSGDERGREAAYTALETRKDGYNAGFLREEAAVHIIVVADEADMSDPDPISIPEWKNYLNGLRPEDDMVTISSIVSPPPPEFPCNYASSHGGYIEVTAAVGGVFWSVCDFNWATALELLGLNASGMKREFFLSELPVPGTIKVKVFEGGTTFEFFEYDPLLMEGDWSYNAGRNSISFVEYVPSALAEVRIEYDELAGSQ